MVLTGNSSREDLHRTETFEPKRATPTVGCIHHNSHPSSDKTAVKGGVKPPSTPVCSRSTDYVLKHRFLWSILISSSTRRRFSALNDLADNALGHTGVNPSPPLGSRLHTSTLHACIAFRACIGCHGCVIAGAQE